MHDACGNHMTATTTQAVILQIAGLVRAQLPRSGPTDGAADLVGVLRNISDLTSRDVMAWFDANRQVLHRTASGTLPVPVMAVSGLGSREVPWTNYLAYMLSPHQPHGLGDTLARSLAEFATGEAVTGELWVWGERELGTTTCAVCTNEHGWRIDMVVMGASVAVAIEQKTTSGPSNWTCCGQTQSQLDAYGTLFPDWVGAQYRAVFGHSQPPLYTSQFLYLTPKGTRARSKSSEWQAISHADLSTALAPALSAATDPVARCNLLALLLDLNSGALGSWAELLARTRGLTHAAADPSFLEVLSMREDLERAPTLVALLAAHAPEFADRWRLSP